MFKLAFQSIFILWIAFFLASCRQDKGRTHLVDVQRKISGSISIEEDFQRDQLNIYVIPLSGVRESVPDLTVNESGGFSFNILDSHLIAQGNLSKAENIARMKAPLPDVEDQYESYARLEIVLGSLDEPESIKYSQLVLPIAASSLRTTQSIIKMPQAIVLQTLGVQTLNVVDDKGQSISDASVITLVSGQVTDADGGLKDAWQTRQFRPSISLTNEQGTAKIFPLDQSSSQSGYTVIAFANNYCTYVSQKILSHSPSTIQLKECPGVEDDSLATIIPSYTQTTPQFEEDLELSDIAKESLSADEYQLRTVAYASKISIELRIDHRGTDLAGFDIKIIEGHDKSQKARPSLSRSYERFESEITLELPNIFSDTTGTTNGNFTIEIRSKHLEKSSYKSSEVNLKKYLFGKKSLEKPIAKFDAVTIAGSASNGVISGASKAEFLVSTPECRPGWSIGIRAFPDIKFVPCESNAGTFTIEDLELFEQDPPEGDVHELKLFLKNKFENISVDDIAGESNHFEVLVDHGTPSIADSSLYLGSNMGFTRSDEQAGSDAQPYVFPLGSLSDGATDTVIINSSNLSTTVFRFTSPSACKTSPVQGDGQYSKSTKGYEIEAIAIGQYEDFEPDLVLCSENELANDLNLSSSSIFFPEDAASDAHFYMVVRDRAGHISLPAKYTIPACSEAVRTQSGTAYCWEP